MIKIMHVPETTCSYMISHSWHHIWQWRGLDGKSWHLEVYSIASLWYVLKKEVNVAASLAVSHWAQADRGPSLAEGDQVFLTITTWWWCGRKKWMWTQCDIFLSHCVHFSWKQSTTINYLIDYFSQTVPDSLDYYYSFLGLTIGCGVPRKPI